MKKNKSWMCTLMVAFFLGHFGVHRFYVGKIGTGFLMLLTFGGLGVWYWIDIIMILIKKFEDSQGNIIKP